MGIRIAGAGLFALLLAALAPLCADGAEPVQAVGNADPALGVRVHSYHSDEKFILYDPPAGVRHAGGVMHWAYNDTNRPGAFSKAQAIASIQGAMAKWHAVCKITFIYDGETTVGFSLPESLDTTNVIGWATSGFQPGVTGITNSGWSVDPNIFIDVDIRLNRNSNSNISNLDVTAVHEVGHALGLDHSNFQQQVMSGPPLSNYTSDGTLHSDDIAGCKALYGARGISPAIIWFLLS